MGSFAAILPIHDEEKMLLRTLPSISHVQPDEVVCVLDRCCDRSGEICRRVLGEKAKLIHVDGELGWRKRINALYRIGVEESSNPIVLLTQADVTLDPEINSLIRYAENHVCSFRNLPYLGWNTLVTFTLSLLPKFKLSGILAMPKEWIHRYGLIQDSELEFDTQIGRKVIEYRLPYLYFRTSCWNLRPYRRERLPEVGRAKRLTGRKPYGVILTSILRLQPEVVVGYLQGGRRNEA